MQKIMILANNSGGLYNFRRQLMQALLDEGIRIDAYTPFSSRVDEMKEMGIHLMETPMDRRGMNPIHDLKLFRLYRHEMKKQQPDYVITYTIKPDIYGGLAARLRHIPYALNITGAGTAFQKDGLLKNMVRILFRTAAKKAKVVFFENKSDRQLFVDEKIVNEKQTVVLHGAGVDLEYFSRMDYPKTEEPFIFLFVGRVMKEKGADELFAAMRKLKVEKCKCKLVIVGFMEEDYREIIEQGEKEGWLEFAGFDPEVRPYIQKAHCAVLPSYHEGMSNTNLECAACGRPLITSDIPGCREAMIDGETGLLCQPKDAESLYNTMKTMITLSAEERERMGKAGRKHMEKEFDKKAVVEETIQHIKQ